MPQSALITVLIVVFIVIRFLMRELRDRHLSVTQLFVLPGIVTALALFYAGSMIALHPASIGEIALEGVAGIAIGVGIGFAVAHYTTVRTAADGRVFFRGSYVTVAIWLTALALRFAARAAFARSHSPVDASIANAALVMLVASALVAMRLLVRAKALSERRRGTPLPESAI